MRKKQNPGYSVQKKKPQAKNGKRIDRPGPESEEDEDEQDESESKSSPPKPSATSQDKQKPLKGILKRPPSSEQERKTKVSSLSPPPRISRVVKDRLAQDDSEIAALEKKLGIKKKKKKVEDGLDDGLEELFGDLGAFGSDEEVAADRVSKRKRTTEDDKWLERKRRKALGEMEEPSSDDDSELDNMDELVSDEDNEDVEGGSNFEGFDSDEDMKPAQPRVRENPYVAPTTADTPQPSKYIPPALRAPPSSDTEVLARLKRQIQGLLNRLSDANMLTILRDIERIYQNSARGYVNTTVVDLLIALLSDETLLSDTFLILHSGFVAAIYKVIGPDFGAQMIERIVSEFDTHYQGNKTGSGKHSTNLISLVAQLYSFQVVGSNLVFDYIRLFLDELSELNTELLLRIVKVSGSQLRQDDPTSLKEIVMRLQKSVARAGESSLPVRTKFMIETINNLKNNRMKTGIAASEIVTEHTTRMKKQLGTMNTRNLKGTEPLRISLADIRDTEKKGKWWLVGASWRNDTTSNVPNLEREGTNSKEPTKSIVETDGEVDLIQLAREQRMNTDVRRAIFISIMSATDFKDAHMRLLKLNLKKSQEMEIPRVIVHCAGCENMYNPYYTLLARKFCSDHKLRKGFQFALWDVFKSLGEKKEDGEGSEDEDDGIEGGISLRRLVNLGKFYGMLIARNGLSITSLKPLNFPYLQPKTKTLVEILLVTTILESQKGAEDSRKEKELLNIFINADSAPEMITGLQFFLKKIVSKTDITASKAEKETVQWACKSVVAMLSRVVATTTLEEN